MEDTKAVMDRCTNGVLACFGDEDYPYAVPVSYVYFNDKIYFHSAKAGHKIDAVMKNPKVSFTVIDEDQIVSEKYTTTQLITVGLPIAFLAIFGLFFTYLRKRRYS